ncbi:MAG: M20/M25/M40 family metallo-hydrolase [Anaerolineae bacterium]|nr:M20/M25/M40 family metallo-hydrolase [Anaerolineae bacterium]
MLRELSEANGISDAEDAVRNIIARHIHQHVNELQIDAMGNLCALKRRTGAVPPRVMAAAHMDEVGLMVTGYDTDGAIRFVAVGGIDARILPGLRVRVGPQHVPGVVLWPPPHINKNNDTVPIDRLRIDIGVTTREAAKRVAEPGDLIAFDSSFVELGPTVRGKAFDDRASCTNLIRLLQGDPFPFDLHAVFTVQEEVGLRGAIIAANRVQPDMAFVMECTACHDLPPTDPDAPDQTTITRMGAGPAISVADRRTISDPRLVQFLVQVADAEGLPHQFRSPQHAGGTDAGSIHVSGTGVPSVTVSTPCRYLHGPNLIMHLEDWENQARLLRAAWMKLDEDVLKR